MRNAASSANADQSSLSRGHPELLLAALRGAKQCDDPFYTPAAVVDCIQNCTRLVELNASALMQCVTPLPPGWTGEFMLTHSVRRSNVPPAPLGQWSAWDDGYNETYWWKPFADQASFGQGWVLNSADPRRLLLPGGGTCGPMCAVASRVAEFIAATTSWPPDEAAALDVGGGVQSFGVCLSTNHGFRTIGAVPWERVGAMRAGYYAQTEIATERGAPLVLESVGAEWRLPFAAGSFHILLACYAAGGSLPRLAAFWFEAQRLLVPDGLIFLDSSKHTSTPNTLDYCIEKLPHGVKYTNRYVEPGTHRGHRKWLTFNASLRVYRRLSEARCAEVHRHGRRGCTTEEAYDGSAEGRAFFACLTPDFTEASPAVAPQQADDSDWDAVIAHFSPWLQLSPEKAAVLEKIDEQVLIRPPPGKKAPHLTMFQYDRLMSDPNVSRAVSILSIEAPDGAFMHALRRNVRQMWAMHPFTLHETRLALPGGARTRSGFALPATLLLDACAQPLPVHPRAYDIIAVYDPIVLARRCIARSIGQHHQQVVVLRHAMFELLRVIRPGPLGHFVLVFTNATSSDDVREAGVTLNDPQSALRRSLLSHFHVAVRGCKWPRTPGETLVCLLTRLWIPQAAGGI